MLGSRLCVVRWFPGARSDAVGRTDRGESDDARSEPRSVRWRRRLASRLEPDSDHSCRSRANPSLACCTCLSGTTPPSTCAPAGAGAASSYHSIQPRGSSRTTAGPSRWRRRSGTWVFHSDLTMSSNVAAFGGHPLGAMRKSSPGGIALFKKEAPSPARLTRLCQVAGSSGNKLRPSSDESWAAETAPRSRIRMASQETLTADESPRFDGSTESS